MQVETCRWDVSERVRLFGKMMLPDASMNAIVVAVHGIGEHSGCYNQWGEKFIDQSIGFLSFDLRGHGRSDGKRGHASLKNLENDLKTVIKYTRKRFPKIPVILFGHSMGGQIVLSYAMSKGVKVQGIITSSPWLKLENPPASWLIKLVKIVSRIMPSFTASTGIKANRLTSGASTKSTKTDPLMHKKISVKLFTDLLENGENILRNKHRLNVPLLMMYGDADRLSSYRAGKSFAQNAGKYTEFKLWKGMYHDLYNDTGNEAVFQYVMNWISRLIKNDGAVQNTRKMYRVA